MEVSGDHLQKFTNKNEDYEESIAQSNIKSIVSHFSLENLIEQFKAYVPRTDIIDLQKLRDSKYLKMKKYKEAAYYGQIINGKRHGKGVMIYQEDRIYEGDWQCDFKHGKGFEQFPNGCIFHGFYVNGKPEGLGRYTWPNGQFFEGEWLNGLKHGSGMWSGAKGDSYVGQWKFGKADGYGVHIWVNGDRYQGEFKQCLKHGEGTEKFASGDLYKGGFYEGKFSGYGEYYWKNGSFYKGAFKKGLREGNGIWKKSSGNSDKYEGEYVAGKKQGYGIFTWYNGNIYKGSYHQDVRQGYGEMYWTDGSYYKGDWVGSIQEGEGIIYTPEEGEKRGVFKDNNMIQIIEIDDYVPKAIVFKKRRFKGKSNQNTQRNQIKSNEKRQPVMYTKSQMKNKPTNFKIKDAPIRIRQNYTRNTTKHSKSNGINTKTLTPPKKGDSNPVARYKYTLEIESKTLTPVQQVKKQHIPHSSILMHRMDKRMNTLGPVDQRPKVYSSRQQPQSTLSQRVQGRQGKPTTPSTRIRGYSLNRSTIL